MPDPLMIIQDLGISFRGRLGVLRHSRRFWGVKNVRLNLEKEDTFCLIGESGSGKSTLALALAGLQPFHQGGLVFKGEEIRSPNDAVHRTVRQKMQMVFQDPVQALNPFRSLGQSLEEPLAARGVKSDQRRKFLEPLIREIGLNDSLLQRFPSQVSGGQKQRVCIARALSTRPELLILDEPLTALDGLIKTRIIRLLGRIKEQYPMACFIITHDMDLVRAMADKVGVIYLGRILETMSGASFFSAPAHPYTRALLSTSFTPGIWKGERILLKGEAPSVRDLPQGCVFHTRCPEASAICKKQMPGPVRLSEDHTVWCHLWG
ncbi:ABC transporter ATP-binding protein [Desulfocicer niacini]